MQLSVIATITARPGQTTEVQAALQQVLAPRRAEDECLQYDLHRDLAQPDRFVMVERWQDDATLDRQTSTADFRALAAMLEASATGLEVTRLDVIA